MGVSKFGDVMVIGGGISGIQASLDLANSGFKVLLVEDSPAIGGHMAQFDKVFPTLDCSMCIESPKLLECARHQNIEILSYHELLSLEGSAGEFRATLLKKPRYVLEQRCRGCGICNLYCPVSVPNVFNEGLSTTKAAHIHFAQAVPLLTTIDGDKCHFIQEGKCSICTEVCDNAAIDLRQREEKITAEVGAIILAPGYQPFDPGVRHDYGYGVLKNVVTGLEFERILNADGPFGGRVLRPSDRSAPAKIAWIQCVGSRQVIAGGHTYCSGVCCMVAIKQATLARERLEPFEAFIFHNDIRTYGKEFEQFYRKAEHSPGIRFVRSYVSLAASPGADGRVGIRYSSEQGVREEEFDMVVLSVGLQPPADAEALAETVRVQLGPHGFCHTPPESALRTSRAGIFAAGAFSGPKDIPESVVGGSGAAALCSEILSGRRWRLATERVYPEERDIRAEEVRVGVFVCR